MKTLIITLFIGFISLLQAEEKWKTTDYEEAFTLAKAQNKSVMISFEGTDWCMWSEFVNRVYFSNPEIQKEISKHHILLQLSYPLRKKTDNDKYLKQYKVNVLPTSVIINTKGKETLRFFTCKPEGRGNTMLPFLKKLNAVK